MVQVPDVDRRLVVVVVTGVVVFSAAGLGLLQNTPEAPLDAATGQTTPEPPDVTPTATPNPGTTTTESATGPPTTATRTPTTTTQTLTTPSSETGTAISVEVTASDPGDVRTPDGRVPRLTGRLSGRISWSVEDARTLTVVVSTWDPEYGWVRERYVDRRVDGPGSVRLSDVLDRDVVTYASDARANVFANLNDDTSAPRVGYVAVTAFVSGPKTTVRGQAVAAYTFTVTNLPDASGNPTLSVSNPGLFGVQNAVPGQSGRQTATVTNTGDAVGDLAIVVEDVTSAENDLIEPERGVDVPGNGGELGEHVLVRIAVVRADGTRTYVVGGPGDFVPFETIEAGVLVSDYRVAPGESVRVVAEWRIPASAGNEIQSDSVALNATYVLTAS